MANADVSDPARDAVRKRIDQALDDFVAAEAAELVEISSDLVPLVETAATFLRGGKRIRPLLAWWGWRGAGGTDCDEAIRACASLEFLQACALIHDDVMDDSDTRRGLPAVHRRAQSWHAEAGWFGDSEQFGHATAILLGDLCLSWADQMLYACGLAHEQLLNAKPTYDVMRTELMAGQYLDIVSQARSQPSVQRSLLVARYKSAKYTIERPLQLGGALAGADRTLIDAMSGFGLPLGEAFQLRDDVLGVFGDPGQTGKPAGDDIREGKQTFLIATALERCDDLGRQTLTAALGNPNLDSPTLAAARDIIVDSGALAATETQIEQQFGVAMETLAAMPLANGAGRELAALADAAVNRAA